jgi:hypothetical protein
MEKASYNYSIDSYNERVASKAHPLFKNLIWLTTDEAATFLRRTPYALRQLAYKGKVRPRKFAGRLYFKRAELDTLIDTSLLY